MLIKYFIVLVVYVTSAQVIWCNDNKNNSSEDIIKPAFALPKIIFRAQTKEEAFSFVLYLSKKLPWFKQNGYKIPLPQHIAFQNLYEQGLVAQDEEMRLRDIFYDEIYTVSDFTKGLRITSSMENAISCLFERLYPLHRNWGFKLMSCYEIILTLYGPGGNYWPRKGYVIVRVDKNGSFGKKSVLESVIHELVHIGIEETIVEKFRLTHWEKERLVDLICVTCFKDVVPNYWMQKIEDTKIDIFATQDAIEKNLPEAIEKFVESKSSAVSK